MTETTTTNSTNQTDGQSLSTADLASAANDTGAAGNQAATQVETRPSGQATSDTQAQPAPLFPANETNDLRSSWSDIQAAFVDDPRQAVEQADTLVAEVMKRLATLFANERQTLESQWEQGEDVSTEDLRLALQRYRSFFDRLLSI